MRRRRRRGESTTSADSVAYATEESGSEAKIGSASVFGSSVSSIWPVCIARPTTSCLTPCVWCRASRHGSSAPGRAGCPGERLLDASA